MNAWDIQTRESFKAGRVLTLRLPANISYNAQQQINSILNNL